MKLAKPRLHGKGPRKVVLLHGGPGACGDLHPVADRLAGKYPVMEPFGTALSIEGQIQKLHLDILDHCEAPIILLGHSWGAWLAVLFAARHPEIVGKLILCNAGPFEQRYAAQIEKTRLGRLTQSQKKCWMDTMEQLSGSNFSGDMNALQDLLLVTDSFDPVAEAFENESSRFLPEVFRSIWPEAVGLRKEGRLLEAAKGLAMPVLALHGDYDPHPADGIGKPLEAVLKDFRFHLLENCGHRPWIEKQAIKPFFEILEGEIESS